MRPSGGGTAAGQAAFHRVVGVDVLCAQLRPLLGRLLRAAEERALAMRNSDRWVEEGCDLESPLVEQEQAALVRSYAAPLSAVHRPAIA